MSNICKDDIIDLTESSSFILVDHCAMSNVIIDLDTDESFYETTDIDNSKSLGKSSTNSKSSSQCRDKESSISERNRNPFGECPICWDALGNSPLASTKCGHVYCLKCLEKSLQIEKKCPTCRCSLKGKTAYHPFMNLTKKTCKELDCEGSFKEFDCPKKWWL